MNLFETLTQIAEHLGLNAQELISYANEDTIGGYHSDPLKRVWPIGSIWEVEGKTLYALVRALKPRRLLEFGTMYGCSATHMLAAMKANDNGATLVCVDYQMDQAAALLTTYPQMVTLLQMPFEEFVLEPNDTQFDFVYEDSKHSEEHVSMLWSYAVAHMVSGLIVSHDAMHFIVGEDVRKGMQAVVGDKARYYLTEPSDCGLGIYQKKEPYTGGWVYMDEGLTAQHMPDPPKPSAFQTMTRSELETEIEQRGFDVSDVTRADGKTGRPRNSDLVAFLEELNSL